MKLLPNKQTLFLKAFGLAKIPMIFFVGASVETLNEKTCIIKIPLNYRTKNHLGSMYFAALCVGADVAGGLIAWDLISKSKSKISLVFKSFKSQFLKRPTSDVYFVCECGDQVKALVEKTLNSDERQNLMVPLRAEIRPKNSSPEIVAEFEIELSLKKKS